MKEIPKAVFIDWNGTLSTSKFWGHLEDPSHPKSNYYTKLQSALFEGPMRELLVPWMRGELTSEDVVTKLSIVTELPYAELFEEFVFSCKTMQLVSPEVLDLVRHLRAKGIKVVIATDNMDSFNRWTVPELELTQHFDEILNSYDLAALKKDFDEKGNSLFFSQFLARNNLTPNQVVIIDDGDDKGLLSGMGIDYRRIEFGVGLVNELKKIVVQGGNETL